MKRECIFIDVFTDVPYAGNQLAVFPYADGISSEQMQKLATEINYSETTFILESSRPEADFEVRIFTVKMEMPFAGHPLIGTAYVIKNLLNGWPREQNTLRLKTKVGIIPLEERDGNLWMTQNQPEFYTQHSDKQLIAGLVGLSAEDIADDLPIEDVSTGNRMLMVPVKSLAAMGRASGQVNQMSSFFEKSGAFAPYLFTLETVSKQAGVHTRFFVGHIGIIEDAATGSAAGPLTAYLLKHKVFDSSFAIENEQGLEMGRPSRILMQGEFRDNRYVIKIGGNCAYVGRGEFEI